MFPIERTQSSKRKHRLPGDLRRARTRWAVQRRKQPIPKDWNVQRRLYQCSLSSFVCKPYRINTDKLVNFFLWTMNTVNVPGLQDLPASRNYRFAVRHNGNRPPNPAEIIKKTRLPLSRLQRPRLFFQSGKAEFRPFLRNCLWTAALFREHRRHDGKSNVWSDLPETTLENRILAPVSMLIYQNHGYRNRRTLSPCAEAGSFFRF